MEKKQDTSNLSSRLQLFDADLDELAASRIDIETFLVKWGELYRQYGYDDNQSARALYLCGREILRKVQRALDELFG